MKPKKPTLKVAMLAHCHRCMGHYQDPDRDCTDTTCPFYSFFPYAKLKPDLSWLNYNPRRRGLILWEDCKTKISEERKEELRERMKEMRKKKNN